MFRRLNSNLYPPNAICNQSAYLVSVGVDTPALISFHLKFADTLSLIQLSLYSHPDKKSHPLKHHPLIAAVKALLCNFHLSAKVTYAFKGVGV
ncbi:hypothetical protein [Methylotenera sp.]|uniref:hypothetical protein n=1 Tax=Methylotenera sp. TaxID=2051956 RepID=UPI002488388B|nr:hypothetical protein [Methylotenera sp.]MDI1298670.1 hypothetical protein [Methylotenera sp.]